MAGFWLVRIYFPLGSRLLRLWGTHPLSLESRIVRLSLLQRQSRACSFHLCCIVSDKCFLRFWGLHQQVEWSISNGIPISVSALSKLKKMKSWKVMWSVKVLKCYDQPRRRGQTRHLRTKMGETWDTGENKNWRFAGGQVSINDPSLLAPVLYTNDQGCVCKVEKAYGTLCTFQKQVSVLIFVCRMLSTVSNS